MAESPAHVSMQGGFGRPLRYRRREEVTVPRPRESRRARMVNCKTPEKLVPVFGARDQLPTVDVGIRDVEMRPGEVLLLLRTFHEPSATG